VRERERERERDKRGEVARELEGEGRGGKKVGSGGEKRRYCSIRVIGWQAGSMHSILFFFFCLSCKGGAQKRSRYLMKGRGRCGWGNARSGAGVLLDGEYLYL